MDLPEGYTYEEATNINIPKVKSIIFQVLEEFGLVPDNPELDADLDDIERNYKDGFFGLIKNPEMQIIATFALFKLDSQSLEIRKMYLLPQYRSKGIGKWMLHFLIAKAKESGCKKLVLKTASVLHAAIALYHKTGFEEVTTVNAGPRCDRAFEMYL